jgi:methionyl-tRNA formyltransferase
MRIGIISDSDAFIPLVYTLAVQKLQVYIYYSPSPDELVNQKVQAFTGQMNIPVMNEKEKDKDLYQWLAKEAFDLCFVIGYKYMIRLNRLAGCSTRLFNIHFGPLPSYKGPIPLFWQLKHGCNTICVSIHQLTDKLDEGPLIWMKETANKDHYNYQTAVQVLSQLCVEGVLFIMSFMAAQLTLPLLQYNSAAPAYYKRPVLNDVVIDWKTMDSRAICNLIRACNPWNKGAITFYKRQEVKLMDALILKQEKERPGEERITAHAGMISEDTEGMHIQCCDGNTINVNMLFFQDSYIPAYYCHSFGFRKGEMFETL